MFAAFRLALTDALAPEQRRAILASLGLAIATLLVLWLGVTALLDAGRFFGNPWFDAPVAVLGSLAALAVAWLLFPAMTLLMLGFFLDGVIAGIERRRYPDLPPPRRLGVGRTLSSSLRLFLLAIVLNLAALPLYLVPGINFFIYYLLNGYLVGREYFELVALRRMDAAATQVMWRRHRGRLVLAGIVMTFLLSVPLLNLLTPVVAAAFMLHVFEGLRRTTVETFTTRRRSRLIDG